MLMKTWTDSRTGYECKILVGPLGCLNGYVNIPKNHPFYNIDDDLDITLEIHVHGGVTFTGTMPERLGDGWWIGFDTAHYNDGLLGNGERKSVEYVEKECTILAAQLFAARSLIRWRIILWLSWVRKLFHKLNWKLRCIAEKLF